ncbi:hypothetical protein HF888_15990 [Bermanella marisrubri]|nr:hypothetical protein [Bermanella marisrubri]QIZ85639.1 hypothetical protein HF888_15990 [Bermanella marisrubri]
MSSFAKDTADNSQGESWFDSWKQRMKEVETSYEECEVLYEEVRNSECAKKINQLFGELYFTVGVSFTERQLKFKNVDTNDDTFILSSGYKPRPIFSATFADRFIGSSNWGYGWGFEYFDDYAFEQIIRPDDSGSQTQRIDLGTYSSMSVIAVSPNVFYAYGRNDATPQRFLKVGLGGHLLYSSVRGQAYITEDPEDTDCYAVSDRLIRGEAVSASEFQNNCERVAFDDGSFGAGVQFYLQADWRRWQLALSASVFNHRSTDGYRFSTEELALTFSRKIRF